MHMTEYIPEMYGSHPSTHTPILCTCKPKPPQSKDEDEEGVLENSEAETDRAVDESLEANTELAINEESLEHNKQLES